MPRSCRARRIERQIMRRRHTMRRLEEWWSPGRLLEGIIENVQKHAMCEERVCSVRNTLQTAWGLPGHDEGLERHACEMRWGTDEWSEWSEWNGLSYACQCNACEMIEDSHRMNIHIMKMKGKGTKAKRQRQTIKMENVCMCMCEEVWPHDCL